MKKLILTKLSESDNPLHPDNIPVGVAATAEINEMYIPKLPPTLDERFYVGWSWSTSAVQEVLSSNTFRTYNSIYKWEVVDE